MQKKRHTMRVVKWTVILAIAWISVLSANPIASFLKTRLLLPQEEGIPSQWHEIQGVEAIRIPINEKIVESFPPFLALEKATLINSEENPLTLNFLTLVDQILNSTESSTDLSNEFNLQREEFIEEAPAEAEEVAPTTEEVAPTTEEVAPTTEEVAPTTEEVAPTTEEVAPATEEVAPITDSLSPLISLLNTYYFDFERYPLPEELTALITSESTASFSTTLLNPAYRYFYGTYPETIDSDGPLYLLIIAHLETTNGASFWMYIENPMPFDDNNFIEKLKSNLKNDSFEAENFSVSLENGINLAPPQIKEASLMLTENGLVVTGIEIEPPGNPTRLSYQWQERENPTDFYQKTYLRGLKNDEKMEVLSSEDPTYRESTGTLELDIDFPIPVPNGFSKHIIISQEGILQFEPALDIVPIQTTEEIPINPTQTLFRSQIMGDSSAHKLVIEEVLYFQNLEDPLKIQIHFQEETGEILMLYDKFPAQFPKESIDAYLGEIEKRGEINLELIRSDHIPILFRPSVSFQDIPGATSDTIPNEFLKKGWLYRIMITPQIGNARGDSYTSEPFHFESNSFQDASLANSLEATQDLKFTQNLGWNELPELDYKLVRTEGVILSSDMDQTLIAELPPVLLSLPQEQIQSISLVFSPYIEEDTKYTIPLSNLWLQIEGRRDEGRIQDGKKYFEFPSSILAIAPQAVRVYLILPARTPSGIYKTSSYYSTTSIP